MCVADAAAGEYCNTEGESISALCRNVRSVNPEGMSVLWAGIHADRLDDRAVMYPAPLPDGAQPGSDLFNLWYDGPYCNKQPENTTEPISHLWCAAVLPLPAGAVPTLSLCPRPAVAGLISVA